MNTADVQQRSPAWYERRRGLPTGSRFHMILTAVQEKPASAQETLINELIAESILPPTEGLVPGHITEEMRQGMILEGEARCAYELEYADAPVSEVGFVLHDSGLFGGSPDALVGDNGGVEIKCPSAVVHIGYFRAGKLPSEYRCQVHGYMIVTGRTQWDFFSYCRNLEPLHLRIKRDEFTDKLEAELYRFCEKYNKEREKFGLKPIGNLPVQPSAETT
jgi:YqaJ-like recombinase protein